ncbi:hypothetical protein, partial [Schwartzia sp. (in: firmicutes)]
HILSEHKCHADSSAEALFFPAKPDELMPGVIGLLQHKKFADKAHKKGEKIRVKKQMKIMKFFTPKTALFLRKKMR